MAFTKEEIEIARDSMAKATRGGLPDCWVEHVETLASALLREAEKEKADSMRELLNHVCGELPRHWRVNIELERDSGQVILTDPDGEEVDFPSNRECIADQLRDAVGAAQAIERGDVPA